jgi:fermentation-respiration switch protein FrsA (DUF1100 family)
MIRESLIPIVTAASFMLSPGLACAQAVAAPVSSLLANHFAYEKPDELIIEETTPTQQQLSFHGRPPQLRDTAIELQPNDKPAKAKTLGQVDIRRLRFRDADGDIVTALLCTPAKKPGPFPLAITIHGLNSNKAQVCGQLAPSLVKRGFAVLAPDMPVHGERPGSPHDLFAAKDWASAVSLHRRAIVDILQCIDLAEKRNDLDTSKGVVLAGYSMGSWLDSIAGPIDPRVKAMVLLVGGATDSAPLLQMLPQLAAADPLRALPLFAGRPLLMLNGRFDPTVTPEMADLLFKAAAEPKEQKWYDSGHRLPERAYDDAADWVARTWKSIRSQTTP